MKENLKHKIYYLYDTKILKKNKKLYILCEREQPIKINQKVIQDLTNKLEKSIFQD